ncbi:MAG: hypothetical protein FD124_1189 [Alphaproteobacteria bacterium]|nr:MAG: hypothetical protein FD160_1296 [Caulobacteraceae bacterium]TPW07353.1 MAG: hypothetical protein FD124_1189 [Alphaproteobacteria bacterium]
MGEMVTIAAFMLLAIFVLEAAWRLALAMLILGPAAYAAIVAAWYSAQSGVDVPVTIILAIAVFALARQATFLLLGSVLDSLREMAIAVRGKRYSSATETGH